MPHMPLMGITIREFVVNEIYIQVAQVSVVRSPRGIFQWDVAVYLLPASPSLIWYLFENNLYRCKKSAILVTTT
jgi:hypothetical protein